MLQSWITQLSALVLVIVCVYALIVGTWRERFGAIIYLAAYGLTIGFGLISLDSNPLYLSKYLLSNYTALYLLVTDMLVLQGLCVIAWKSPHPWPKWAMLGQLISVALHGAMLLNLGLGERAYLTLATTVGWGVVLALLIGTIAARQARQKARREGPVLQA
ncbi:hypothetical protein [Asticcacaulis sp. AC402]|uniref:hypothetical protein n=1 Tax=Asticcacaulis sp. AC402 TaxID=1282361 RepID=UPI0003C3B69B|nr:hypothetical protein [Asticcacaulis sp. AC402]ESQ77674.1 hypothetical protein ABAC402_00670 [Asticcacaulis sp. AC402]